MAELEPYGAARTSWICPAIWRLGAADDGTMPKVHYAPSQFDPRPFAPYEFPKQPWLVEIASAHATGANICFPDGSIRSLQSLLEPKK